MEPKIKDNFIQEVRQERLDSIEWVTKKQTAVKSESDISITKVKNSGSWAINVIFRNETWKKFGGEYISLGVYKGRLYFKPDENGYKISFSTVSKCKNRTLSSRKTDLFDSFIGSYDLKYDDLLELFYIEKGDKA